MRYLDKPDILRFRLPSLMLATKSLKVDTGGQSFLAHREYGRIPFGPEPHRYGLFVRRSGAENSIAPDAIDVVAWVIAQDLTAEHSGDLLADALDWWDADGQRLADMGMWAEFCEQPIDIFRLLMAK